MLTERQRQLLALCCINNLNWNHVAREAQRPGGLETLLTGEASERSRQAAEAEILLRQGLRGLDRLFDEAEEKAAPAFEVGARLTTVLDDDFPLNLRAIFNLPPFLFYLGRLDAEDVRAVAVVGTRTASKDGTHRAIKLSRLLVQHGVTVLSGLAEGIDTAAHVASLDASGRTVAVMGTGICRVFPRENEGLAKRIVDSGGALVSQFWPLTSPTTYTFPRRNVTMSGMGQGTVVVEASATSGAKLQARLALEHGKFVFLLDSLVKNYSWARGYLDRGAIQVDSVDTILRYLKTERAVRAMTKQHRQLRLGL